MLLSNLLLLFGEQLAARGATNNGTQDSSTTVHSPGRQAQTLRLVGFKMGKLRAFNDTDPSSEKQKVIMLLIDNRSDRDQRENCEPSGCT